MKTYERSVIGRRVSIQWTGDRGKPWYSGRIAEYRPTDETHLVVYDDGDQKAHHLGSEEEVGQVKWLDEAAATEEGKPNEDGAEPAAKRAKAEGSASSASSRRTPAPRGPSEAASPAAPSPAPKHTKGSKGSKSAIAARPAEQREITVEFKFTSCQTYLLGSYVWEGHLRLPMLQDMASGCYQLAAGTTQAAGVVVRRRQNGDDQQQTFTASFRKPSAEAPPEHFALGYRLETHIEDDVYTRMQPVGSRREYGGKVTPFECPCTGSESRAAKWEANGGGLLVAYAACSATIDDAAGRARRRSARYKLKLYTVASAHVPHEPLGAWDSTRPPDWPALEALIAARYPTRPAAYAARAVEQYVHFLTLKHEHADYECEKFMPSKAIDEVWVGHLAFLDRYHHDSRCVSQGGERLIEHAALHGREAYIRYVACHKAHSVRMRDLGLTVDKDFWPPPKAAHDNFNDEEDGDSDDHIDFDE